MNTVMQYVMVHAVNTAIGHRRRNGKKTHTNKTGTTMKAGKIG
jgi:hypothetical protein